MKNIVALLLFIFSVNSVFAGYEILFCTGVDSLGHCKGKSDLFAWNGDKMKLQIIVVNKEKLNTGRLNYKIFQMKNDKAGDLYAELSCYVKPYWRAAAKQVYFVKTGYYKVEVYNAANQLLQSAYITISERIEE